MKRILNFRPLFFCFVGLALGIRFARDIFNLKPLIWAIFLSLFFVFLAINIIRFVLDRRSLRGEEKRPPIHFFRGLLCVSIAFLVGIGSYSWDYYRLSNNKIYTEEVTITGRANDELSRNATSSVLLTDVTINGEKAKNIQAYIWADASYEIGARLTITAIPQSVDYYELEEFRTYYYRDNVGYILYASIGSSATAEEGNMTFFESFRKSVKDILDAEMNEDSAQIAYSALFGDQSGLDDSTIEAFRNSGIAHLLSVSGLHFTFFTLILSFILSKLKIRRYYSFAITAIVLIIYAALCSFTSPVVRSGLMCLILLSANLFGKQYDTLTSLSLAGLIILILRPLSVYDVGFQLSFFSVFAICLFAKPLQDAFQKIKMPKFIASSLAMTISAQIGITPIVASTFGTASILTPIANIICIPIFEMAYMLLVVLLIISIIPFLRFLLAAPELLFKLVLIIASGIADVEGSILNLPYMDYTLIILFYVGFFMLSRFVMLKGKIKLSSFSALFALSFCFAFLEGQRTYETSFSVLYSYNANCQVVTNKDGDVTVVLSSDAINLDKLVTYLRLKNITSVNQIITMGEVRSADLDTFSSLYLSSDATTIVTEQFKTVYDLHSYGVIVSADELRFVVTADAITPNNSELLNLLEMTYFGEEFDVLWQEDEKNYNAFNNFKYTTSVQRLSSANNYSVDELGNFTMTFKDGKLASVRSND